ncbi:hypothetical protein [Kribbella sp. DT2]|uniref:hypothetical protein n=1 Tax=Kribbella sp. DT2 TaxID=3393427 RepID=UPI003CF8AEC6
MLKRTLALSLLLTAQALPAPAAPAAPAAIGPVTVAWSDATHTKIRITWTETTPVANTLSADSDADEGDGFPVGEFGTTTAAQPNEYLVTAKQLSKTTDPASHSWIVVAGGGTQARSVDFDQFLYDGDLQLSFVGDKIRWTLPPDDSVDGTPGDPLDLPKKFTYTARQRVDSNPASSDECSNTDYVSTTPTGDLPNRGQAYALPVFTENEWGGRVDYGWVAYTKSMSVASPASTPYGGTTTLRGTVNETVLNEEVSTPYCEELFLPAADEPVTVMQRTAGNAPWTVVGTTKTDGLGNYTAVFRNPGHRQYQVVRPSKVEYGTSATYGYTRYVEPVRATTRIVSAKFINPVVNLGTQPQAYLWVDPAGTQKAALQFKNASGAWQGVTYKTLYAGRGLIAFPWNKRGVTQFRWYVPATPVADASYSGVFTLTVR